jgi:type IV pilus assembly protein PilV
MEAGFAMLEVLVAIVISVIGILGMISLQARTYQAEAESYQRSQALVILDDIAARMASNRTEAASYVRDGIGEGETEDCDAEPTVAARDLCEIANQLRGTAETSAAGLVTPMSQPRACISNPAPNTYLIAVVWAGIVPTAAPANACEAGAYGDESLRRAVSSVVVVANLEG